MTHMLSSTSTGSLTHFGSPKYSMDFENIDSNSMAVWKTFDMDA